MKAGIMVDALGMSQQSFRIITEINKVSQNIDRYIDIMVFYYRYDKAPLSPFFATLQQQEVWGFDGPVMATSIQSAETLIRCPCPKAKFFYVWDLEWVHNPYLKYSYLRNIYQHPEIKLIARSESHSDVIERCWKKPVATLQDFNYEQLVTIFDSAG